jgi:WD40 repeat protein
MIGFFRRFAIQTTLCVLFGLIVLWNIQAQPLRSIRAIALNFDGSQIAIGYSSGAIEIQEVDSGSTLQRLPGHTDRISGLAWMSDDNLLASSSDDGRVIIWDVERGRSLHTIYPSRQNLLYAIVSLTVSADGQHIAYQDAYGSVYTWSLATATQTWSGVAMDGAASDIALNPDGSKLAVAGYVHNDEHSTITIMDLKTLGVLQFPDTNVTALIWSDNGGMLALGTVQGVIELRDGENGQIVSQIQDPENELVAALFWRPGTNQVASVTRDDRILVWDTDADRLLTAYDVPGNIQLFSWAGSGNRFAYTIEDEGFFVVDAGLFEQRPQSP